MQTRRSSIFHLATRELGSLLLCMGLNYVDLFATILIWIYSLVVEIQLDFGRSISSMKLTLIVRNYIWHLCHSLEWHLWHAFIAGQSLAHANYLKIIKYISTTMWFCTKSLLFICNIFDRLSYCVDLTLWHEKLSNFIIFSCKFFKNTI